MRIFPPEMDLHQIDMQIKDKAVHDDVVHIKLTFVFGVDEWEETR